MIRLLREIFLGKWLLPGLASIAFLFALSHEMEYLFPIAQGLCLVFVALVLADLFMLFGTQVKLSATRKLPQVFSLGDDNPVTIRVQNMSSISQTIELIDELPEQLQYRSFAVNMKLDERTESEFEYKIRPTERGEFHFGDIRLLVSGPLRLFRRRITVPAAAMVKVFPSILQMKEFELRAFSRIATIDGIKKLRRSGVSYEFDQINPYVKGDDIRHINWKATARRQGIMVNRYETERSQAVYSVICKNREMRMPFNGLSLLDHAVNTSLAVSNVAQLKYDKVGLITFSDRIGSALKASRDRQQMKRIMNALYSEKERETEANYDLLSLSLRQVVPNRSLVFLYINFESPYALDRALPHLKMISKRHLLVVIFFKNVEIESFTQSAAEDVRGVYTRTIAQKMLHEKEAMYKKLQQAQIQTILTEPDKLSMRTVDKYLELKGRGMI